MEGIFSRPKPITLPNAPAARGNLDTADLSVFVMGLGL